MFRPGEKLVKLITQNMEVSGSTDLLCCCLDLSHNIPYHQTGWVGEEQECGSLKLPQILLCLFIIAG